MQAQLKRRRLRQTCAVAALVLMLGAALVLDGRALHSPAAVRWCARLSSASIFARAALVGHPMPPVPSPLPPLVAVPAASRLPMAMKPIVTAPSGLAWLTKMRDELCRCTEIECARTLQSDYARSIGPVDLSGVDPSETSRLTREASDCTARLLGEIPRPAAEEAGG